MAPGYVRIRVDHALLREDWSDAELATAVRLIAHAGAFRDERQPEELYVTWGTVCELTGRKAKHLARERLELVGRRIGFKVDERKRGVVLHWPALAVTRARCPFVIGGRR